MEQVQSIEDAIAQSKNFKSDHQKLIINLLHTTSILKTNIQRVCKVYDLTPEQYNILRILRGQNKSPITIKEIKHRMVDQSSNVGRILDKLYEKQFIEGEYCNLDKRKYQAIISNKGLEVLAFIQDNLDEKEKSLLPLTKEEFVSMNFLLDKIRNHIQNY